MPKNTFRQRSDTSLNSWAEHLTNIVGGNISGYKTTLAKNTAASDKQALFATAIADWEAAKYALASAVDAKEFARNELLDAVAVVANDIYVGGVSDSMVSAAGLEPRDHVRTPATPQQPTALLATPDADGSVLLKWNRGTNAYGMNFVVEATTDGENWTIVTTTMKSRITLFGYEPGDVAYFRVRAIKNGATSEPSNTEAIYLPVPSGSNMKVAA